MGRKRVSILTIHPRMGPPPGRHPATPTGAFLNEPLPSAEDAADLRAEEPPHRRVGLLRRLELRQMPAVELEMLRAGKRLADVAGEADRYEAVVAAPHEQ
jgi:hypothetical protein